jgi:mRNA interferase HigB
VVPLHSHADRETFYVLEGAVEGYSDGEWHQLGAWGCSKTFNSADIVAGNKVIFDVGGNKYRIVGLVAFRSKRIFVLFVGTHAQYDAIDVKDL